MLVVLSLSQHMACTRALTSPNQVGVAIKEHSALHDY